MSNENSVRTHDCPSPDCARSFGAIVELAEHVNTEHSGEFKRKDWPDTEAGRLTRRKKRDDSNESDEE